jgi:hypothetical protein
MAWKYNKPKVYSKLLCYSVVSIMALFCTFQLYSQDKINLELGIGYPFPDKKFFSYYEGRFSVYSSLTYQVADNVYTGISFDYSKTKQENPNVFARFSIPTGTIKYRIGIVQKLLITPELGFGLFIMSLKCSDYSYSENQLGFDIYGKIATGYTLNHRIDICVSYRFDYMYLQYDEGFTVLDYYRTLHLSNLRAGVNIKF